MVWGAGGLRLPCLPGLGAALTVFFLCHQSHRGLQARATQRAGDGRPIDPQGPGQGQVAALAPGPVGVLFGLLLRVPALGLPSHLPGQAGRLQVASHRQAGEVGLSLEPQALQGRAQQVDPGGLGVVPALCRGQGQVGEGAWWSLAQWMRAGSRGGQRLLVSLVTAQPQACPLPRATGPCCFQKGSGPVTSRCPQPGWGLTCRQALSAAESSPPFSPPTLGCPRD